MTLSDVESQFSYNTQMRVSEILTLIGTYKPAYRKPIAPEFLAAASELCDMYVAASNEARADIRSTISLNGSRVMGVLASRLAVEAVRQSSPDLIHKALIALSIEDCQFDSRDSTICLSMVFNSAVKLGVDVPQVFNEVAAISGARGAKLLLTWLGREPKLQALSAFYLAEGTNAEGQFAYISTKS